MESLNKLTEALKIFQQDLRGLDSKLSVKEGDILGKTEKAEKLSKEVKDLEDKKSKLIDFLGQVESNLKKEYEAKERDLKVKSDQLDTQRGQVKKLELQADIERKNAIDAQEKYGKMYNEYDKKLSDLKAKQEQLQAVKF